MRSERMDSSFAGSPPGALEFAHDVQFFAGFGGADPVLVVVGEEFGDVVDEGLGFGGGHVEVLYDVFGGEAAFVEGVVGDTGAHERIEEPAREAVEGNVEVIEAELAAPEDTLVVAEEVVVGGEAD